jgi:hypothetical protein
MEGVQPQQVGGWAGGGMRTFRLPEHRRGVVMQGCYSHFGDVAVCRNNIWVHNRGGEVEIDVGEGARGALGSYQVRGYVIGEAVAPNIRLVFRVAGGCLVRWNKEDSS